MQTVVVRNRGGTQLVWRGLSISPGDVVIAGGCCYLMKSFVDAEQVVGNRWAELARTSAAHMHNTCMCVADG